MNSSSGVSNGDDGKGVLRRLTERCCANLAGDAQAKEYLRANGVSSEGVWKAFRVGICDGGMQDHAALKPVLVKIGVNPIATASILCGSALLIPTFDPRQPEIVVGLIAQRFNQNKHGFVSKHVGLACSPDVADQKRVIITDAPLLAMRLMQAGVVGVIVAEVPEVLPPIVNWLAEREVVVAAYKRCGLQALVNALANQKATPVLVPSDFEKLGLDAKLALGIETGVTATAAMPSTFHLKFLLDYSQARLRDGEGAELLRKLGCDDADFASVYQLGFLPPDFMDALGPEARRVLAEKDIGGSVIVPAFDERGIVADLLAVRVDGTALNFNPSPSGLAAPKVVTAFDEIVVVDTLTEAASLFRSGRRNVLLLRGVEDAKHNAHRIWASGVSRAEVLAAKDAGQIAAALGAVGIDVIGMEAPSASESVEESLAAPSVEPPAAPVLPELVEHDIKKGEARFKAGDATYSVMLDPDGGTKLHVELERGGRIHPDTFDLAVDAQRRRFASNGAMRTGVPFEAVIDHLIHLFAAVRRLHDEAAGGGKSKATTEAMSAAEREEALSFLRRPDLLDAIARDLDGLGLVGEEKNKRLLYLTSISRKLPMPLSAALLSSSGAGKSKSIETVASLTPPEDMIHVSRLSDTALFYFDRDALRHKLLVIDESDVLSTEVLVALRVLQSRGALTQTCVQRDPLTGQAATHFVEARGPVAVLTSTAGDLDEQVLSRCLRLSVDESPIQTGRIAEAKLRLRSDPAFAGEGRQAQVVRKHQNLQRLVEAIPVVTPFAARIQFPASSIQHRRLLEKVLNMIEASALLHQHQRLKKMNENGEEYVVADMRDFDIAVELAADMIGRASDELSVHARDVLALIQEKRLTEFNINELWALKSEWTHHKLRTGLEELAAMDVIASPKRTRPRRYELLASSAAILAAPKVQLRPAAFGDSGTFGESGFPVITPKAAMG